MEKGWGCMKEKREHEILGPRDKETITDDARGAIGRIRGHYRNMRPCEKYCKWAMIESGRHYGDREMKSHDR
ncbi:MAG: hypothetical protein ACK559_18790, partial [bacterium]